MRNAIPLSLALLIPQLAAQGEAVDAKAVEILRKHGLEQSQVMDHLSWICDVHGPRLTGSPNLRNAQKWALETFRKWGLHDPHLEEWGPFGRGWQFEDFSMTVTGNNPWPVHAWPKAWSPALAKTEVEVIDVSALTADQVKALDLSNKIVLAESPRAIAEAFDGYSHRLDAEDLLGMTNGTRSISRARRTQRGNQTSRTRGFRRQAGVMQLLFEKKPLAILTRGYKGDYGTIFVSSASMPSPGDVPRSERPRPWKPNGVDVIPQFTLAVEHYNRIVRLLQKKIPVRMSVELKARYYDDNPMQHNVIAEIPGTDPEIRDEIVMLGAHYDSWHSGTGATDNGCGSAVMIEAIRLVHELCKETKTGPRRTIRVALWSGEEQGLYGSRNYVSRHFAERADRTAPPKLKPLHAKLSGYYNLDNGTGKVRGVYLQGNDACLPIFRAWLAPFHDLGAASLTINNTGGTDHLAFDGVGLPGFQFIQDPVSYSTRTHHSNMDNWDHAVADDLKQAATVIASFVWHTSQRDQKLPRKPQRTAADATARRRR